MSYVIEQCLHDGEICSYREFMPLTMLDKVSIQVYCNEVPTSNSSSIKIDFREVGMVYTEITALKKGVIRLDNHWWFALATCNNVISPGQQVYVTCVQGNTLFIEPCQDS